MTAAPGNVLIVGAGLAGARCAETLRAEGFDGRITLVGEEPVPPYERPALSKEFLSGARHTDDLTLRSPSFWADQGIALLLGRRVARIDMGTRTAPLSGGPALPWDALVLATGARARHLPGLEAPAGVHHLRTVADAFALREELVPGTRLAIVGAGFVGAEVASTARSLGVDVTLVDVRLPLERALGREVGSILGDRFEANGVELRLGAGLSGFRAGPGGRIRSVILSDGEEIRCDAALVGIGAVPASELLPQLESRDGGVITDACGRTAIPGVYACGDVASAWRSWLGAGLRVEHWTGAAGQGAAVARAILGAEAPHEDLPYFWSDQFGLRLQHVGHAEHWAHVDLEGDTDSFRARYLGSDGRLLAALVANRPRDVGPLRHELAAARVPLAA